MLKTILCILILLNSVFVVESLIGNFTGYQAFIFNDPNQRWILYILRLTVLSTLLFLILFSSRIFSPFTRFRQIWESKKKRRIFSFFALFFTLIYASFALTYWVYSEFSYSEILKQTTYPSPSHRKAVIFKEVRYPHSNINIAYEKRWIFEKRAFMEIISVTPQSTSSLNKASSDVLDKLHDPSHMEIIWSEDEESLIWKIKTESDSVTGVVEFE